MDLTAPWYLRELVKKKNKSANTRLADDSFLFVVPPISKGSVNTFLNDFLFMLGPVRIINWMVVLENFLRLTYLNVKVKQLYF